MSVTTAYGVDEIVLATLFVLSRLLTRKTRSLKIWTFFFYQYRIADDTFVHRGGRWVCAVSSFAAFS